MVCLSDRRIQLSSVSVKLYTYTLYCEFSTTHTWCCCTAWRSGVARIWCQEGHDDWGAEGASIEAPNAPSGVVYGEGCPLPSRLEGLGSVVSSPSAGFGAEPRPLSHFLHILGHRTLLVPRQIRFFCPQYKENFACIKLQGGGGTCPSAACLATPLAWRNMKPINYICSLKVKRCNLHVEVIGEQRRCVVTQQNST